MKSFLIYILKKYKRVVSPVAQAVFGSACRFTPSCSEYTIDALGKYGALKGTIMGVKRVFRCHPFGGFGYDPVE